jgi:hypothetical protein
MPVQPAVPAALLAWMHPLRASFSRPTWSHVLILVTGAILTPGRRTVTTALSIMGLRSVATFTNCHRVLNRNRWSSAKLAYRLLTRVTRLRLDARLFEPAPPRRPGTIGRPRAAGARRPTMAERLVDPKTPWRRVKVTGWYGRGERLRDIVSGTAVWYRPGRQVPIRWVLVRDVAGEFAPQGFLCTDLKADPSDILRWFVRRWSTEVTFAEVRRHLGVQTQRQWSDLAIARTTPALLSLFSLVTLWANELFADSPARPRRAAWYSKPHLTFGDALAAVRHRLWTSAAFSSSTGYADMTKVPRALLDRLTEAACFPA